MSFLKTTCAQCGEIELPIERVLLRIDERNDTGVCVFRCPQCSRRFVKEANEAMMVMLLAVGIEVSMWSSAMSYRRRDDLPAISAADVAAFRERLGDESELVRHFESI